MSNGPASASDRTNHPSGSLNPKSSHSRTHSDGLFHNTISDSMLSRGQTGPASLGSGLGSTGLDSSSTDTSISGGPLAYQYKVHSIMIHYGQTDDVGSEHSIEGLLFPGEVIDLPHTSHCLYTFKLITLIIDTKIIRLD